MNKLIGELSDKLEVSGTLEVNPPTQGIDEDRKPSALDNVDDLEKLIDDRTQRTLDVLGAAVDNDFDDHEMIQVGTYATNNGKLASIPTGRLEDLKVEEPSESTFRVILGRAKVAISRIIEQKKHYVAGPFYTNRKQRKAIAKRLGIPWKQLKQAPVQPQSTPEPVLTSGM